MKDRLASLLQPGQPRAYLLACGSLALSMTLVGSYVALSRPLVAVMPVFLLATLRFGIGALAMLHWLKKPSDEPALSRGTWRWLFLQALLGNFLFSIFMLHGMRLTSAVTAGIIMASIPAAVALFSRIFLREQLTPRIWLAMLLAVTGMGLAPLAQHQAGLPAMPAALDGSALLGPALLLGAVMCEAAYAVIGKRLLRDMGVRRISAVINLWGLALMAPLGLMQAWHFEFNTVSAGLWFLLVFYALAASVWSVWLWMTGLHQVSAAHSGIFTVFLPISAALTGVWALGETVSAAHALALLLGLLGVILATWQPAPPIKPSEAVAAGTISRGKID